MTGNRTTRGIAAMGLLACLTLTGCGNFFVDPTSPGGGSGGTAGTGDYLYVLNNAAGGATLGSLSAYTIASTGLTELAGSPSTLTTAPLSIAVSRPNTFVFVGSPGSIGCYSINSDGTLTASTTGGASLPSATYGSLVTSPVGSWLLALDTNLLTVSVFSINTTSCALTLTTTTQFPIPTGSTPSPRSLRIAPSAALVAVALGAAGNVFFTFNSSTGALAVSASLPAPAGATVNDVLFDPTSSYAFTANSGAAVGQSTINSFSVASNGAVAEIGNGVSSGSAPRSMVLYTLAATSTVAATTYLYAANTGDATLSGYTVAGGTLTPIAGPAFASSTGVFALALDQTGKYLLAANNVAPDLTLYGFDLFAPSKLISIAQISNASTSTGTAGLATTHGTGNVTAGN